MVHPFEGSRFDCSIEEKICTANEFFARWGAELGHDPAVKRLLRQLRSDLAASTNATQELGVIAACKYCDEQEGGSCCGAGIENRYSSVLLLINLLLGVTLPVKRYSLGSCYFLGDRGCLLHARQVICVNYLCTKVQNILLTDDLIKLQTVNGAELDTMFLLHERIKKFTVR